jgi:DNA-3-methyladenine glycosylase I
MGARAATMTAAHHRCEWAAGGTPLDLAYHDEEWGVPTRDPIRLFEFLVLEGAQAGLSWSTILRKREGYRAAFAGFDPEQVAAFDDDDVTRLLGDPGIVRNRAKVAAAIGNAKAWLALDDPVALMWSFVGGEPLQNRFEHLHELPAETDASQAMSRELRRLGFRFVGPTICYALMQACGLVNDHVVTCFRHDAVRALG